MVDADDRKKADKTGVYKVVDAYGTETHMRFKEGAYLPDGAEWRDEGKPQEPSMTERQQAEIKRKTEERSKGAAPENRAKGAALETK